MISETIKLEEYNKLKEAYDRICKELDSLQRFYKEYILWGNIGSLPHSYNGINLFIQDKLIIEG